MAMNTHKRTLTFGSGALFALILASCGSTDGTSVVSLDPTEIESTSVAFLPEAESLETSVRTLSLSAANVAGTQSLESFTASRRLPPARETAPTSRATIVGTGSSETLTGTNQNDTFVGSGGNDVLDGLAGFDTVDYQSLGAPIVLLPLGLIAKVGVGTDQILNQERIIAPTFTFNTIDASAGGDGFNTIIDLPGEEFTLQGNGLNLSFVVENFIDAFGNARGNDVITGNGQQNFLTGVDGADTIAGGPGRDLFILGDASGVFYLGGGVADRAEITDFTNGDFLQLAAGNYTLTIFNDRTEITSDDNGGELIAILRGNFNPFFIPAQTFFI